MTAVHVRFTVLLTTHYFLSDTEHYIDQCFSTFVRPRPGKFFFFTRRVPGSKRFTRQYLSKFFLSSYIKLKKGLIINYGIIIKSISTIMCTVWYVDKYKVTFKLVITSRRISRGPV